MAVNVLDYGADPTGLSDSHLAFRAAHDAFGGGDYIIPPGTYKIGDQVGVNKLLNFRTEGARRTTILLPAGASQASFAITDINGSGTAFRGLRFDGSAETSLRYYPVRVGSASLPFTQVPQDVAIEDLLFDHINGTSVLIRNGVKIRARNIGFDSRGAPQGADTNDFEMSEHSIDGLWIEDCWSYGSGENGALRSQSFVDLELTGEPPAGSGPVRNLWIKNNRLYHLTHGIELSSGVGAHVSEDIFIESNILRNCGMGVVASGNTLGARLSILNNTFIEGGGGGAQIVLGTTWYDVQIRGGLMSASGTEAIHLSSPRTLVEGVSVYGAPVGIFIGAGTDSPTVMSNALNACNVGVRFSGPVTGAWLGHNHYRNCPVRIEANGATWDGPDA